MTSFAQGNPFNSGSVWESMRFPAPATDTTTLAGTGNYGDMFGMDRLRSYMSGIPKEADETERLMYGMYGINALNRQENLAMMPQILLMTSDIQRQNALEANKIARENMVLGSVVDAFTNKLPQAIGGAFRARNAYLPEQVQIAAAGAGRGIPSVASPNYYGFVR
jgi:hypothetical protein